jgi:hypothetical protein
MSATHKNTAKNKKIAILHSRVFTLKNNSQSYCKKTVAAITINR